MNELVKQKSLEYERNEGFEKGRSKGIEETIKAMFKENLNINTISRITNKTKKEIEIILNNKHI